jgi:tetratricopeptide (TPR) repeat protein
MALEFFLKELSSRREAKDTFNEARVLLQIGEIFYELHDWQKSFDFYSQALPLYRQMKITDGESIALYQLSLVSKYLKNYSQSVQYFEELFLVAQTNDARCRASSILGHIADTYLESGNDARAFEYYDKWLAYDRKQNSEMCEYFALKATGTAYEARGKKAEALEFYRKALELLTRFSLNFRSDYITDETKRLRETVERLEK